MQGACRDTLGMWSKFNSTNCVCHGSFSFWSKHRNFSCALKKKQLLSISMLFLQWIQWVRNVHVISLCICSLSMPGTHDARGQTRGRLADSRCPSHASPQCQGMREWEGWQKEREMGGSLLCLACSRALCTFDPHYPTVCPPLCILIAMCTFSPLLPDKEKAHVWAHYVKVKSEIILRCSDSQQTPWKDEAAAAYSQNKAWIKLDVTLFGA